MQTNLFEFFDLFSNVTFDNAEPLISSHFPNEIISRKEFSDVKYLNLESRGISFVFDISLNYHLSMIQIYLAGLKHFKPYNGPLPYFESEPQFKGFISQIVTALGQPSKKGGGKYGVPLWISYDSIKENKSFGMQFEFLRNNWSDPENPIGMISLFKN